MIVGMIRPNDGSDHASDERDITQLPMYKRARLGIGYLPQEPSIFRGLTVEENILAILETLPLLARGRASARLDELLDEIDIAHIRKSRATSSRAASGGAWRSRARWSPSRSSCCSTSRSRASTRSRSPTCSGS